MRQHRYWSGSGLVITPREHSAKCRFHTEYVEHVRAYANGVDRCRIALALSHHVATERERGESRECALGRAIIHDIGRGHVAARLLARSVVLVQGHELAGVRVWRGRK